jgi:cellulose synthase/poly-beta-1,6-N-acetylglucosamine synthase-like glycosyltransferase
MKKVLVACPIFEGMRYCFNEFIESVKKIDYPSFDILVVDNSRKKDFYEKLKEVGGIKALFDVPLRRKILIG